MKLILKVARYFLIVLVFLILLYLLVLTPHQISGGNPGPYKNGETVFSVSKHIFKLLRPIKAGDVVIFEVRPGPANPSDIALVVGIPGDKTEGNAYYLSNEKMEGVVPSGFYLVRFDDSEIVRAIPESQISGVVWYPPR